MKIRLSLATAIVLLAVSVYAQGLPNFTGTWTFDAAKSDFGPIPPPESIVMVIDHKEPTLKVNVTQKTPMGDAANDSTYTTDGKDNINKMRSPAGEQDVKSTTKWNGKTLTTSRTIEAQGMTIGIDETWDLSADGKVLTINRMLKTPQGDFNTKITMNKK
ncbi:MAG TPA: hypothetical protein VFI56_03005 [Vicinamibacterales bacterium]|nr:hypothetical protein [Vicinamibacterales bacterium]